MTSDDSLFLEAAFVAAADAVLITDEKGTIRWINPAFTTMTGWSAEEAIGQRPSLLKSGQHEPQFYRDLWSTIRGGRTWRGQIVNRRKDGSRYTEQQTITPVIDGGEIRGYVAVKQDVSERERLAVTLRQREARYRALLENMLDVVFVMDRRGRIVYVSPSIERVLGYRPEERLGRSAFDLVHPDDIPAITGLLAAGSRQTGFTASAQYRLRHRDGTWRWVEAVGTNRFDDPVVAGAVVTVRDITERHEADALQLKLRAQLAQSEKLAALGELLSGVAHELNNPLSVVIGFAGLLRTVPDPAVHERAKKIAAAAERCGRIVKNFLAVARQHPPERQRVAIPTLVQQAVELLAYPLRVDSVEVRLDLAPDMPTIWADPYQLHQVLVNLITNAFHALRGAPAPRAIAIAARYLAARDAVEIDISDNGPGIAAEVEARIFEPFFTTKPVGQGTGLGLPICKGIVEAHDGTIEVEGRQGVGARFRIVLPVGTASTDADERSSMLPAQGHGETVLVVDDEPDVAQVLADALTRAGYTVETAANGRDALTAIAERDDIHVVLTDMKMPELDGPGLYRAVAAQRPDLLDRFAFMTGDTLSPITSAFLKDVGAPALMKPLDLDDVARLVARLVGAGREPARAAT
jgi:nitrogen fixation negative regulator NifL